MSSFSVHPMLLVRVVLHIAWQCIRHPIKTYKNGKRFRQEDKDDE